MTVYFLDTSALLKRYIVESGTVWVQAATSLQAANKILVSEITVVEMVSGIARLKRESRIPMRTARALRLLINRHMHREYHAVLLSEVILQTAQDLLDKHPLRAYDSIQLASALDSNAKLIRSGLSPLVFVSADTRLLNAATGEGLPTHQPI